MKTIKNIISIGLSVLILMCSLSVNALFTVAEETQANTVFQGEGTESSPYLISTKEDLYMLSKLINNTETAEGYYKKYYKQTTDIDLENELFEPIGDWREDATKCGFEGVYDGNYHKIINLYVDNPERGAGLFRTIIGRVQNLSVYGKIIGDSVWSGGIASNTHNGKIINCSFNGEISSKNNSYMGGIVGRIWRTGTIEGCYFNGTLSSNKAGGIVGVAYAGYEDVVQEVNVSNSYATGKIESSDISGGGIVNHAILNNDESKIKLKNNYYLSTLASVGVGGQSEVGCTKLVENALKACADMLGKPFVDNNWDNGFNDGYPIFEWQAKPIFVGEGTEESPYLISTKEDLHMLSKLINNTETAEGYYKKYYKQTTDIDLENELFEPIGDWREDATKCAFNGIYDGNYHKITGLNVENPKRRAGLFSLLGGILKNLSVYGNVTANVQCGGLVGNTHGGTIENCSFNGKVTGDGIYVGGLVGQVWRQATIKNSYFNGELISNNEESMTGGLVGVAFVGYENNVHYLNISNCYATGSIKSVNEFTGGIVGHTKLNNDGSTITYSNNYYLYTLSNGAVNGKAEVGCTKLADSALKACADMLSESFINNNWTNEFNDGYPIFKWQAMPHKFEGEGTVENPYKIYNKNDLYAMKDMITNPYLKDQYNTKAYVQMSNIDLKNEKWEPEKFYFYGIYDGNCKSINNLYVDADYRDSGLFALVNGQNSMIKNLVVSGSVKGQNNVGGITGNIGYGTTIENCAFIGDVSGTKGAVGGISGYIWQGGNVKNSYHTGSVTSESTSEVGGIIGYVDVGSDNGYNAVIENCYHAGKASGSSEKTGGIVGNINIETKHPAKVNIINCYYLKNSATDTVASGSPTNDDTSVVTENVLNLLAEDLGAPFVTNTIDNINNGYPVFSWQLKSVNSLEVKLAGDTNCDNNVDIADVVILKCYLINSNNYSISEQGKVNADVNNRGNGLNAQDSLAILKYALKLIYSFEGI
ncbi:MAG: dockerin type I repeat-containing protein [Ruminococcus sp.]|nr:dockerin type I repeat-containing protein [Ruminococcus sp.]